MDCLKKEQLIILQNHLPYEVFEKFMSLFNKDELLPIDNQLLVAKILEILKDHEYWGESYGWGNKKKYTKITQTLPLELAEIFKGKMKSQLLNYLDSNK